MATTRAAIGFRAHSGWAAAVAVAGSTRSPVVVDRRRLELADSSIPGSVQPYHEAEGLDFSKAEKLVKRCVESSRLLARRGVGAVVDDLGRQGHSVVGCGLLLASGRPLPDLAAILASHALIHAAEGELFRDVLARAAEHSSLPVTRIRERELLEYGSGALGVPAAELQRRIAQMGKSLGPPWRQDEKLATLVGWLALAAANRG